jgi:hypothetical protein
MKQHIREESSTALTRWSAFAIMRNTMPPRDPDDEEEEEEDDEDAEEENDPDEPPFVREPDED